MLCDYALANERILNQLHNSLSLFRLPQVLNQHPHA